MLIFSAVILCFLAGIRGNTVGTDIKQYAESCFNRAHGFSSFFKFAKNTSVEAGYAFIAYFLSKITTELGWMLFFSQLLVIGPIYISTYLMRNKSSFSMVCIIYCLWFYCFSLNIMRQSIACAFLILGAVLLKQNKKIKAIVVAFIAFLFHSSAIFGILIYLICLYACYGKQINSIFKKMIITIGIIVGMSFFSYLLQIFATIGLLGNKYSMGINPAQNVQDLSVVEFGLRACIIFAPIILRKFIRNKADGDLAFLNYFMIVGYILSFGKEISTYLTRLVYYCNYFSLLAIPMNINNIHNKNNCKIIRIVEFVLLFIYWYQIYIYMGWHEVVPFVTRF